MVEPGVRDQTLPRPCQGLPGGAAVDHVQHPAMRDHHRRLPALLQAAFDQGPHRPHDTGVELTARLAACRREVGVVTLPALHDLGVPFADVVQGQALDHTEGLLAPEGFGPGRGLPLTGQRLGGLAGAQQVAGEQGARRLRSQVQPQALRLLQAQRVERRVQVALETQFAVPVGFAVSHKPEINHDGHYAFDTRNDRVTF